MKHRPLILGALLALAMLVAPHRAHAQNPPPGAILDLATVHPGPFNASTYVQFSVNFVASAPTQFVSFAFREVPAYFSLDSVSVTLQGSSVNLLQDPDFESNTPANVGTNFPVGWNRWIQAVDTSAIGVVAGNGNNQSCNSSGPRSGSYFWCDGSVEGYDALYQQLNGLTPGATYTITFWVTDNSGQGLTNPTIDMLVYAGSTLPTGSVPIGPGPSTTPAPRTISLVILGFAGLSVYQWYRVTRRRTKEEL